MIWCDTNITWDSIASYIQSVTGIEYLDNPTEWSNAFKAYVEENNLKYVKYVDRTGMGRKGYVNADVYDKYVEAGEWIEVGFDATEAEAASSAGGMASAPVAKTIVTESTGGGTAVITDQAIGTKSIGLSTPARGINIISGLLNCYGLFMTGVNIVNSPVYKDMINYAFSSDPEHPVLSPLDPWEKCVEFLINYGITTITDLNSDGEITVSIPDTIADRIYNFLSNHMVLEQTPGIYPSVTVFNYIYNFIQRTYDFTDSTATLARYFSATNPTDTAQMFFVDIGDDLFKETILDFVQQVTGSGFTIASSVITALMASMAGIQQFMKTGSSDAVDNATLVNIRWTLNRGSNPPPKSTPISLSEISGYIEYFENSDLEIHEDAEEHKYYNANLNFSPANMPELHTGMYYAGDCTKYLKRGYTGEEDSDYAFRVYIPGRGQTSPTQRGWTCGINYPSNEQNLTYGYAPGSHINYYWINGYPVGADSHETVSDGGLSRGYSNLGYTGMVDSYMPDDYLVTAGIRSKTDTAGNPEKHPDPTKTKEQVYGQMANKKQIAQAKYDPTTGQMVNTIDNYVGVSIPYGPTAGQQILDHGTDRTADPAAYVNPNSQQDNLKGKVNTNDPASSIGESIQDAVDEFNETRKTPESYPDPLPENYPNPQYPPNPPQYPGGESGDTPDPTAMITVTASGMVSVYNPTKQQLIDFSAWLWSPNFLDNFLKLFQNPMDAIIGLHLLYATPVSSGSEHIIAGYLDSGVSSKVVTNQFSYIDCGTVAVPEYYGSAIDYEPYTQVHVYLPFIGIQSLKPNDIIGKKLNIKYGVDALTGTCLAILTTTKGESEIACYNFSGNCATQIPVSGGNYAQMITGLASLAVGVGAAVATGNPIGLAGAAIGVTNSHFDVSHSGSLGANAGAMGIRKPYLIITRKKAFDANAYGQFYGFPANKTIVLGSCNGYTRVKSVHIETIARATDTEKTEIETLLKAGVIIR